MKQQSVKRELKRVMSNKRVDSNCPSKQGGFDLSSSKGFKSRRNGSMPENHQLKSQITGVGIFNKFNNKSLRSKHLRIKGSMLSNKDEPFVISNIKQIKESKEAEIKKNNGRALIL